MTKVKKRFTAPNQQCIYKDFLQALHKYQMEHRSVDVVSAQIRVLFAGHPDLINEFSLFLPSVTSDSPSTAAVTLPSTSSQSPPAPHLDWNQKPVLTPFTSAGSLFGGAAAAAPVSASLFGGTPAPALALFGSAPATTGSSVFGGFGGIGGAAAAAPAPAGNMFGGTAAASPTVAPKLPEAIFWVQCNDCHRWRIVNGLTFEEQTKLQKQPWLCRMHPDVSQRQCDVVANVSSRQHTHCLTACRCVFRVHSLREL